MLYESPGGNLVDGLPPASSWHPQRKRTQTVTGLTKVKIGQNLKIRFNFW